MKMLSEIHALRGEIKELRSQLKQTTPEWQLATAPDGRIFLFHAPLLLLFESARDPKNEELALHRVRTDVVSQLQDKSKPGTKWDWQLKVSSNSTPILHNTSTADTFYGVRNTSSEIEMRRLKTNSPIMQALATIVSENGASSPAPEQQPASTSPDRH